MSARHLIAPTDREILQETNRLRAEYAIDPDTAHGIAHVTTILQRFGIQAIFNGGSYAMKALTKEELQIRQDRLRRMLAVHIPESSPSSALDGAREEDSGILKMLFGFAGAVALAAAIGLMVL